MVDVVNIEDHIDLVCPNCNQTAFYIRKSRTLECATCGSVPPIEWKWIEEGNND